MAEPRNPNIKRGLALLLTAAVVCFGSIVLISLGMTFLGTSFPEELGLLLYICGPLPIIPAIIAAIGAVMLVVGSAQGSGKRK